MALGKARCRLLLAAGVLAAVAGCQPATGPDEKPGPTAQPTRDAAQEPVQAKPSAAKQQAEDETPEPKPQPPPPPKIAEVHMPEQLAKTCLVRVGDVMPGGELTSLEGKPQPFASVQGGKLTAVFFWKGNDVYAQMAAVDALQFLDEDVAKPYAEKGVRVVAVNVGDAPEAVKKTASEAKVGFPVLLDPQGAYFSKVATERFPRLYLLDAAGRILWFDTEYSRTTRNNLLEAVRAALGEPAT